MIENAKARKNENAKGTDLNTETRRRTDGGERVMEVIRRVHPLTSTTSITPSFLSVSPCLRVDPFRRISRFRSFALSRSLFVGLSLFLTGGCRGERAKAIVATPAADTGATGSPARFVDVAETSGVHFKHSNGASGRMYLAETMGSGCAFLDYDRDGRLDLFLVNSSRLPCSSKKGPFYPALYRQQADGSFMDVTREAGLAIDCYGMGCAVGDYDNDGHPDLYLTAYGGSHLFHNMGNGRFAEVTRAAGAPGPGFGTSAAWFDYDRDGFLDLFVCSYCRWTPALNQSCGDICGPSYYRGTSSILYRNNGDGTFTDVTRRAKVDRDQGKALGVVVWDYDGDGWLDFAVANDTVPNWLFRNNRNGTFSEVGVEAGIAYSNTGQARAGMGIDTADWSSSGQAALLIGNNAGEGLGLFCPEVAPASTGGLHFMDHAEESGALRPSLPFSTFGAVFVDVNRDGFPDIVTANGHINHQLARQGGGSGFAQQMQLLLNVPGATPDTRRFQDATESAGDALRQPRVARGLAVGDVDRDGDPDLLVNVNDGRAALLRNESEDRNHWLAIRLRGGRSNREGIGTRVVMRAAGRTQTGWVRSGSSYCSDSEHVARFGLGQETQVDSVELRWPSGIVQTLRDVRADQLLTVTEAG
jgi:enediyne biosynthesis protein E4